MIYRFFAALVRTIVGIVVVAVAGVIAWKLAFNTPTLQFNRQAGAPSQDELPDGAPEETASAAAISNAAEVAKFATGWLSRSDQVRFAQAMLRQLAFDPGPLDGLQGGKTRAAVRAFQAEHGAVQTGSIDQALLEELAKAISAKGRDPMTILKKIKQ